MLDQKLQDPFTGYYSHTNRSEVKNYVVSEAARELAKVLPKPEGFGNSFLPCNCKNCKKERQTGSKLVNSLVANWAETSSHKMTQLAAQELFQGKSDSYYRKNYSKELDRTKLILKVIYEITQKEFKARGIRYLILYRGQRSKILSLQPLSAFSTSKNVAKGFGGHLHSGSIPAKYIASSFFTGYGCANEQEYVVIGDGGVNKHLKYEIAY